MKQSNNPGFGVNQNKPQKNVLLRFQSVHLFLELMKEICPIRDKMVNDVSNTYISCGKSLQFLFLSLKTNNLGFATGRLAWIWPQATCYIKLYTMLIVSVFNNTSLKVLKKI